jgi:hypothetical protein
MMKTILISLVSLIYIASITSCVDDNVLPEDSTSKTGIVSGKVTDAMGKPLAGIKITIEHTLWHANYVFGETDVKGNYNITMPELPAGTWTAHAQINKSAYGNEYKFDLDGSTTAFTQSESVVRNFTWKLSGSKSNNEAFYGAHLDLYNLFGTDAPLDKIKIMFMPIEPTLIEGSPANAFERNVENVAGTFMVKDIPIGKYTVKAVYPGKILLLKSKRISDVEAINKTVVFGKYGYLADTEYNIEFMVSE